MRYLVAVPVFNEQRHLPRVLKAISAYADDILIVDDGSTDGSGRILAAWPRIHVITHAENRGYGQSVIDALRFADWHGYDWVITIDCDEQHEPACIPQFLAATAGEADVISGSRYLRKFADDDPAPPDRRRINNTITLLLDQLFGLQLTDSFCGFKAHRVTAMRRLLLDEPGYAFPLQFWAECVRAGLTIRELAIPRIYRDRSRTFGGTLDDPAQRLRHYLEVLLRAMRRAESDGFAPAASSRCVCELSE
ncbi:MAG: glycosyltransferase family 2 protein [Planctomycetes bacterium]|nr:glycosyltransferase family 2 protein [Planctomycetota bacterium]